LHYVAKAVLSTSFSIPLSSLEMIS
jgi:hypothetical protein